MKRQTDGFILPAVLLIGIGTLIVGLSMISVSSSIRSSIENQYYNKIATEAAEAGADYASYCLKTNGYVQTWGPAAGRPNLTQSTDCTGAALASPIASLTATTTLRSGFSVGDIVRSTDNAYIVSAVSQIDRVSGSGITVTSYTSTQRRALGAPSIKFGAVTYGYYPTGRIAGGEGSFFAVRGSDGKYRVAGANQAGQLGNGTTINSLSPQLYAVPGTSTAVNAYSNFVSQGYNLFVTTDDGNVYGAGLGSSGQLGNGGTAATNATPQRFQLPTGEKGTYVAPKGDVTYVLTESHNLYAAGACTNGQLGVSSSYAATSSCGIALTTPKRVLLPTPNTNDLNTIPGNNIVVDSSSVFVRMQGGRIYGWGNNAYGQLGNGTSNNTNVPIQVGSFGNSGYPKALQITFDGDTLFVVADDCNAYAAGRNDYGEIGLSKTTAKYTTFQKIPLPASAGCVTQASTDQWTILLRTAGSGGKGQVWGAGLNSTGELGNGTTSGYTTSPVRFILPNGVGANYVYNAGLGGGLYNNTFVVGDDGKVYGAGGNSVGQLGLGYNSSYVATPAAMGVFGSDTRAADVITGLGTTIVLSTDQVYYTMGKNNYGQLGNGTTTDTNTPAAAQYLKVIPAYLF